MSQNAIQDAIAAAKLAAQNSPSEISGALAGQELANVGGTAVGAPVGRGAPIGLDDLMTGSMAVDGYIKLKEFGILVGSDTKFHETLEVEIDLSAIQYKYSVRWGNPVNYASTYDRVTDSRGGSWLATLTKAQAVDPKASEFRSADIPFTLLEDVIGKDGGVVFEAGKTVGHSLAITGWKGFAAFIKNLQNKGYDVYNDTVRITLGYEVQKNAKGTWGVLSYGDPKAVN